MSNENDPETQDKKAELRQYFLDKSIEEIKSLIYQQPHLINRTDEYVKYRPLYFDNLKEFWIWNDHSWEIIDVEDLINRLRTQKILRVKNPDRNEETNELIPFNKAVKDSEEDFVINQDNIIKHLKLSARKYAPKKPSVDMIQFKDSLVNISNGKLSKPSPEYFITNPIPWSIGETEDTPTMDKIFEEWVGKEYVQQLYEIIAYCCYPAYPINRVFILNGGGTNGKGRFFALIRKFIGNNNITASDIIDLSTKKFEASKLYRKLACVIGETDGKPLTSTKILKMLSGEDLISFEKKYENAFDEKNYAKILVSTNELPRTYDKTIGFYRRMLIIDFPNEFRDGKDILENIPEEEYHNLAKKCINLLMELLKRGSFTNEPSTEEKERMYEDRSNPLLRFIKEQCYTEDPEASISCNDFYNTFVDFCSIKKIRCPNEIKVGRQLTSFGFKKTTLYEKGDRKAGRVGIRLKSHEEVIDVIRSNQ